MRRWLVAVLLGLCGTSWAQTFPDRPIRLVVGFPPGGGSDAIARVVGPALAQELRVAVVVDNRAGAGGVIATEQVARSAPDGYTLQLATAGSYTIAPSLRKLAYDPARDLEAVALLVKYPNLLVVSATAGINTVLELVAQAKAQPGKLNFASSGAGTIPHLAFEYLNAQSGIQLAHIPYKGNAPAVTDLLAGVVPLMIGDPGPLLPHVAAGKLKVLGVTSKARSPLFPQIPSIAEEGIPGYDVSLWLGVTGPAGMPRDVVALLSAAIARVMAREDVAARVAANGMEVAFGGPPVFVRLLEDERARWADLIRRKKITE